MRVELRELLVSLEENTRDARQDTDARPKTSFALCPSQARSQLRAAERGTGLSSSYHGKTFDGSHCVSNNNSQLSMTWENELLYC